MSYLVFIPAAVLVPQVDQIWPAVPMFDTPQRVDALTYMGQFRNDETDNGESNKSVTSHIYSTKVKPGLNGQFLVNYVSLSTNGSGSNGSSHSSIYCLLPTCQPLPSLPPPPRRVLIPQRGRVSEPERDGDGGGLLMWRSAAAIATWGLLSFNQTKTWWRMCTARGNCRGVGGGRQGRAVRKGAGATGRVAQGGST